MRVNLLQEACNQLRQIRFFLMAVEFKEREKKLLIQLFEYGDSRDKDKLGNRPISDKQGSVSEQQLLF